MFSPFQKIRKMEVETGLGNAHKNPHPSLAVMGQPRPGIPGILQQLPACLEKQALLGIHSHGVPGGDGKEQGIEIGKPL